MWARILAWAIRVGGEVHRWVLANRALILRWISWGWTFVELVAEILRRVF